MPDYSAVAGWSGAIAGAMQANAANSISKKQIAGSNYIREQNNMVVAAENSRDKVLTGIQRWRQQVHNSRVVENAANDQEALAVNHFRQKDQIARADFATQIGYAEQQGRMAAQAASSGVSGGVVDMLNVSMRIKQGMENNARAQAERQLDSDYERKQMSVWWANMDQLDQSVILDNMRGADYRHDLSFSVASPMQGLTVENLKGIAQGNYDFSFKSTPTPNRDEWDRVDYQQRGDN